MTAEKRFPDVSLVSSWSARDTIDICHELSRCNWVPTGRIADAVSTWRTGRVQFASGQSLVVCMQTRREVDTTRTVRKNPLRNTQCEHGLTPWWHSQVYPTPVPFANGTRRVIRVHTQSIKTCIPHKLQSSTTYSRHQGSIVERGKLKCNTYKTLSPIINYS